MGQAIQWYPGHIAKLERALKQHIAPLDVVVELVDARIPESTWYPSLSETIGPKKPMLLLLGKADLADPSGTQRWCTHFKALYPMVLPHAMGKTREKTTLVEALVQLGEASWQKLEAKGLKRRPLRVGIIGMPNVGKSTLINMLVGQKKVKTGHRAGVTRVPQWVRIHPQLELLDTPGLIPPRLNSPEHGEHLAWAYGVGDATFEEEAIVPSLLETIERLYPGQLAALFGLPTNTPLDLPTLAIHRHALLSGGEPDTRRIAQALLKDFRLGRLGRLTLEHPPQHPVETAAGI